MQFGLDGLEVAHPADTSPDGAIGTSLPFVWCVALFVFPHGYGPDVAYSAVRPGLRRVKRSTKSSATSFGGHCMS